MPSQVEIPDPAPFAASLPGTYTISDEGNTVHYYAPQAVKEPVTPPVPFLSISLTLHTVPLIESVNKPVIFYLPGNREEAMKAMIKRIDTIFNAAGLP